MGKQSLEGPEPSLADLLGELADDGRRLIRAEAGLYTTIARHRLEKASAGAMALVGGLFLLNAALIVLLVGLALALAIHVGPLFAGLIVFAVAAAIGGMLVRFGLSRMKALSGDAEEKTALEAGKGPI